VEDLQELLATVEFPGGSRLTYEPGGQLELSGPPGCTAVQAVDPIRADLAEVERALASRGWHLDSGAYDGRREPRRVNGLARYGEMEKWFAEGGWSTAPQMMCNTAAVQVNVGCGPDPALTWRRANRMAATLAAAFAASPDEEWASCRLKVWAGLDSSRTRSAFSSGDPLDDWTAYAMSAKAMLRQVADGIIRIACGPTFAEWVAGVALPDEPPTLSDFDLHLSTLFPPVRLKGWIEIRVFDMPSQNDWPVPVAVTAALLTGDEVDGEEDLLAPVTGVDWTEAARRGLGDADLRAAAQGLIDAAISRLADERSPLTAQVSAWAGRCL
jgi:glutamate--cysteine ligase